MSKKIIIKNPKIMQINGLCFSSEFLIEQVERIIEKELLKRSIFCDIEIKR